MGCPDDNMLVAMVEHTLDPQLFGELEVHIDSCAHCRELVGALAAKHSFAVGTPGGSGEGRELGADAQVNDRYTIDSVLGRGGMGTVYLARDVTLGRDVALKLHRPGSGNERLQREAIAMAKLAHPNVVTVFEIATLEDRLYVAMEYVRGGTLRSWLAERSRSWREIVALLVEVGAGLSAAHAAGLVHRDFKPENVLVGEDGRPRVSDFGLARADGTVSGASELVRATPIAIGSAPTIASTPRDAAMTQTGTLMGTPAYMAPEQFVGGRVDARCDQFAFCVVVWECLFGKRPFTGATIAAIQLAIENQVIEKTSDHDVPDRVCRVLERGLAVDADARYADMPALLSALREAAVPRTRRQIMIGSAAAIAVAATALVAGSAWSSRRREAACANEANEVRGVFDAETRAKVQRQLLATGSPFAQSAFDHTAKVIDRYIGALADQTISVCRGRDEPQRITAARRTCLTDRKIELAGFVDELVHADADVVQRAPGTAWAIFDPSPCEDASVGAANVSTPEQAAKLERVRTLFGAGHAQEGIAIATPLLADARAKADHNLELATLLLLGQMQDELESPDAVTTFYQAEGLAETQGRDLDASVALVSLARLAGLTQHDHVAAHRFIDLAHAKLARLGNVNLAMNATLSGTQAQVLMDELRFPEAETAIHGAIAGLEQVYGPDHPKVGAAVGISSEILAGEGKHEEAVRAGQRTLDILERALGDDNPQVAGSQMNLASALIDVKRYDDARKLLLAADAVFARLYGPTHPTRISIFGNLGGLEQVQEHWEAALTAYRTALAITEQTAGALSPTAAGVRHDIARTLLFAGRAEEALPEALRAVEILEKLGADGESRLQSMLTDLAGIQIDRKRPDLAIPIAQRALAIAAKLPDAGVAGDLADTRFVLARAMWDAHRDRPQARAMAQQARVGQTEPDKQAAIDRWLATAK